MENIEEEEKSPPAKQIDNKVMHSDGREELIEKAYSKEMKLQAKKQNLRDQIFNKT